MFYHFFFRIGCFFFWFWFFKKSESLSPSRGLLALLKLALGAALHILVHSEDLSSDKRGGQKRENAFDNRVVAVSRSDSRVAKLVERLTGHRACGNLQEGRLGGLCAHTRRHPADHQIWRHREDIDTASLRLVCQRLTEAEVEALGGSVRSEHRAGRRCRKGRKADNRTAALRLEASEGVLGHLQLRLAIHLNDPQVLLDIDLIEVVGILVVDANIVHEHCELQSVELSEEGLVFSCTGR
mmetsp:Transcript_77770/g.90775  ORF Transcript_77770/g.90775 Transcript_77770/m.90775 type:complete len:240 (-) Transcript_77770:361-1080(-)